MPIAFLGKVSLRCVLVFAVLQGPEVLFAGDRASHATKPTRSHLEIKTGDGGRYLLHIERDTTVSPKSAPTDVKVLGEVKGSAIIVIDSYQSFPGGMSYCQAGRERFLRVVAISKVPPREMWRVKLESCHDNIELATDGVEWIPESFMLKVHWLLGPTVAGKSEEWLLRVNQGIAGN